MTGNVVISVVDAIMYVVLRKAEKHVINDAWHKPRLLYTSLSVLKWGRFEMSNSLKCISHLYSAKRLGSCEELKVRAVRQSFRIGVEYGYLFFDSYALVMIVIMIKMMMIIIINLTMTVMVV
jgi:hypothetical protein